MTTSSSLPPYLTHTAYERELCHAPDNIATEDESFLKVFIGYDSRFPSPARVLAYSLLKGSTYPLQIHYLNLEQLQAHGLKFRQDPLASTEFTYSRFLVPYLCNYTGKALFLGNDMVCLGDVRELAELDMKDYALRVVKNDHQVLDGSIKMYGAQQTAYPRKNWSSLMLMDCNKLRDWTPQVIEEGNGARLHRFQDVRDELIGDAPAAWNVLDHMIPNTKLLHYTTGGPWYAGHVNCPHAKVWKRYELMLQAARGVTWKL